MKDQGDRDPTYFSTPMIHGRLRAIVLDMGARTLPKSVRLNELVDWVMHDLPTIAPDDPRTDEAVRLARVLWERSRD
jgi:hypothetical protein